MGSSSDFKDPYSQLCAIHIQANSLTNVKLEGTASGILIDSRHRYVLTHASLLYPLHELFHHNLLRNLRIHGSSKTSKILLDNVNLEVILPNPPVNDNVAISDDKNIQPVLLHNSTNNDRLFTKCKGRLKMVFEIKRLCEVIHSLMPKDTWTFEVDNNVLAGNNDSRESSYLPEKKNEDLYFFLLPCFVLIQLQDSPPFNKSPSLRFRDASCNKVGDDVEICATPFGSMSPDVFLNSRSRGIISKVTGRDKVLLMTDARCVPGCEGGGLFYVHKDER